MEQIDSTVLEFHTNNDTLPFPMVSQDENFGIFTIKMKKTEMTDVPLFILFTIDKTGSMCEYGSNNHSSKMDYVKQTFQNMINYLAKQDIEIYICVQSFNVEVNTDIENERVSIETAPLLIQKIDALNPEGSTNIELALEKATETLYRYEQAFPDHQIAHVFMTDGDPTVGKKSKTELFDLVDERFANIFVGFGMDHNASLLKKLSDKKNGEYQFVDNMENTALVYGETIHRFLYPALSNVTIRANNGLIYNWQTNDWVEQIYEPVLISEVEKIYQIKSSTKDLMEIEVWANDECLCTDLAMPELVDETGSRIKHDLSKYSYRLKVQEILFDVRNLDTREKKNELKLIMKSVFKKIRLYMRENCLINDSFMNLLCDDISVTYKTMDSRSGEAYASARQTSQGRQQSYTPAQRDVNNEKDAFAMSIPRQNTMSIPRQNTMSIPRQNTMSTYTVLQHHNATRSQQELEEMQMLQLPPSDEDEANDEDVDVDVDEDDLDNFLPSNSNVSCYATQSGIQTMRCMSQTDDDFNN